MNILPFVRKVEDASTLSDVWDQARFGFEALGFEFFVYLTVAKDFTDPFGLSNLPELFKQASPDQDPFLHYCCDNYELTFTGPDYLEDYDYLPETAQQFIAAARDLGFRSGFGVPVRLRGSSRFGGFNLGTGLQRDIFEARMEPKQEEVRFLCLIVHRKIEEITSKANGQVPDHFRELLIVPDQKTVAGLSPREMEVVYHIGHGLSRKECARVLGISHNTVSEHIKNAYRKLGVRNRAEASQKMTLPPPPNEGGWRKKPF